MQFAKEFLASMEVAPHAGYFCGSANMPNSIYLFLSCFYDPFLLCVSVTMG